MTIRIPLSSISIGALENRHVAEVMRSTMISSASPVVAAFEAALGARLGADHVVAAASGTCALELALRALGVGPGDEVIVPALTFASPVAAVMLVGATPVIVDVSPEHWTIDPQEVARHIGPRTRAIVAVDVLGHPADYDALAAFGIPVIEDAAEAIGARYKGRPTGSLGTIAIFSFHANKTIATGEGGCVATNDAAIGARVRQLTNFGMNPQRRYWHEFAGHNHRMTGLVAAVGLAQVMRWDELIGARAQVTRWYDDAFALAGVTRRPVMSWADEATWLYTIADDRRDDILRACAGRGVDARAIWPAIPDQPAFADLAQGAYPVTRRISDTALWLPTSAGLTEAEVGEVVQGVLEGHSRAKAA